MTSETYGNIVESRSLVGEQYREIVNPTGFVHTNDMAFTLGDYVGKQVILIEFMRYGCVNCQRSFPHLVAWSAQYASKGLIIIGIHTPQFPYEGEKDNVTKAMEAAGIAFPIVLDNEYATWNAYENHYWPRTLIIDTHGTIVYDHIGAGRYDEIEEKIQELLQ
jgi:thiol-disulfide isomerase/thioredoxin